MRCDNAVKKYDKNENQVDKIKYILLVCFAYKATLNTTFFFFKWNNFLKTKKIVMETEVECRLLGSFA